MSQISNRWFLGTPEFRKGPYPQDLICQGLSTGKIKQTVKACPEHSDEWRPIAQWPEFAHVIQTVHSSTTAFSTSSKPRVNHSANTEKRKTGRGHADPDTYEKMLGDLKGINFLQEIIPIDKSNLLSLVRDPFFWGTLILGVGPLLICTFNNTQIQSNGMAFIFAALWAVVFKMLVAKNYQEYGVSIAAFFFTGMIGIWLMVFAMTFLPKFYLSLPDHSNVFTRLVGSIITTGVTEELCKFLPVGIYLLWKRHHAKPLMIVWIAICSALGFAAFENLLYEQVIARNASILTECVVGQSDAVNDRVVIIAMLSYVLRSLSCVFGHAVYAGIFGYFVATAFCTKKRVLILCFLGLMLSATFHGMYNWFCEVQPTFAAFNNIVAFALFYGYLIKLRSLVREGNSALNLSI